MAKKGISIVKVDVNELIKKLNKAYCDEWLAYYQYWIGAKVVSGLGKDAIIAELVEHATDELNHANIIAERIIQLGGTPILEPKEWYTHTNCGYDAPQNPFVVNILEQNVRGEQCAIGVYSQLLDFTAENKDPVTHNMIVKILEEEVQHEEDLQELLNDIKLTWEHHSCK